MSDDNKDEKQDHPPKITGFELAVAVLSAVCVVAIVATLIHEQFHEEHPAAVVSLTLERIEKQEQGYLALVTAHNSGGKTASRLQCAAELMQGSNVVERSTAQVEFAPPKSKQKVGFFFTREPSEASLRLKPIGYEQR